MPILQSLLLVAVAAATRTASVVGPNQAPPPIPREFRGVWVATVDNIDWPSKRTLSTAEQQQELVHLMDVAARMHLNAIILQVRPSADALYNSRYEPWSEFLTGRQGRAPQPAWDPLEFAVQQAHMRGLELHCWFNPYRAFHPAQHGPLASRHIARRSPALVKQYGKYLWMDPGEPEVQRLSLKVILDVVHRYDIDGVHIDDYFYPYKEKGPDGKYIDFPDDTSRQRYVDSGGTLARDDWRRKNVDDFISNLYSGIKKEKCWVKLGISPFGIYRPGFPAGIKAGVDQYADLYADARKWLANGWCDYFTPQLYWPIHQTAQSYPRLLNWWIEQNDSGRHVWPGLFTSQTASKWSPVEIVNQISIERGDTLQPGEVHFSMKAFLDDYSGIRSKLQSGLYAQTALVPASKWLGDLVPDPPSIRTRSDGNSLSVDLRSVGKDPVRFFTVQAFAGGHWLPATVTSDTEVTLSAPQRDRPTRLAITAVDRVGNQSLPTLVSVR